MARHKPSVREGSVARVLLTLPQWGLCDLIPVPPTLFSFDSNTAVEGEQLAMTQKPQSVLRLRHQYWMTAMSNPLQ